MLKALAKLFFPPRCVWCGRILDEGDECAACLADLPRVRGRQASKEFYSAVSAPFLYTGRVRESIVRMKFRRKQSYIAVYARYLSDTIREELAGEYDLITFVPVSRRRKRERGFDQAELLAARTAALTGDEFAAALRKTRDNGRQSRLRDEAARRANVSNCYKCVMPVEGRRVLLIDDVITTGATVSECARTLLMAGARDVTAACVAVAGKKK